MDYWQHWTSHWPLSGTTQAFSPIPGNTNSTISDIFQKVEWYNSERIRSRLRLHKGWGVVMESEFSVVMLNNTVEMDCQKKNITIQLKYNFRWTVKNIWEQVCNKYHRAVTIFMGNLWHFWPNVYFLSMYILFVLAFLGEEDEYKAHLFENV